MASEADQFDAIVTAILARYAAQGGEVWPREAMARFAAQLRRLIAARGLPPPLQPGEPGAPGGMTEAECAPLVAAVLEGVASTPRVTEAARQLVKACFYPEFTVCRDSYRETARDGVCRRQELSRCRDRVSGSHCVDCPHWIALGAAEHARFLAEAWCGERATFEAARTVFLPEDFRRLRHWLHAAARRPTAF